MKILRTVLLLAAVAALAGEARGASYIYSFNDGLANGGAIPDGNTSGWSDTRVLSGIADSSIVDVNVSLQITGGYNGDLYAYLTHESGFSVLLNRPGRTGANVFGYGDAGLNITFDDSAANGDIHNYQAVGGYPALIVNGSSWSPDARNVNPLLTLDSDDRTRFLSQFNELDPNGGWTLFVADLSNGEQSTVAGWGLNITSVAPVPEPSILSLGGLACLVMLRQRTKRRNRPSPVS